MITTSSDSEHETPHKRKYDDDSVSSILSEEIKRFRISVTPGELRMKKDLNDLCNHHGLRIEYSEAPSSVVIKFSNSYILSPMTFRINIPRYYPHDIPVITCINSALLYDFFDAQGVVSLESLGVHWTATCSLSDVLLAIQNYFILHEQGKQGFNFPSLQSPTQSTLADNFSVASIS